MNRKQLKLGKNHSCTFSLKSSSTLLSIAYNEEEMVYVVDYFEAPFDDELDIYDLEILKLSAHTYFDDVEGYAFYGSYWDSVIKNKYLIFCKRVNRVEVS